MAATTGRMCDCTITSRRALRSSESGGSAAVARNVRRQRLNASVGAIDSSTITTNSVIFKCKSGWVAYHDAPLMPQTMRTSPVPSTRSSPPIPVGTARASVEHVWGAPTKAGTRQSAYETLRRDRHARALPDLPPRSWAAPLKALPGNPHPAYVATSSGRGVLLRLLLGETLDLLLRDDDLILALALAAPSGGGGELS